MSSPPPQRRQDTLHSGRALKSADFGASYGGSPPEQPQIKGLGLPPPTQMIRIPERVRSADAVVNSLTLESTPLSLRLAKLSRSARYSALLIGSTVRDQAIDSGRYLAHLYARARQALAQQQLGERTKEGTLASVRAAAKYSAQGTRSSMRTLRRAYLQIRAAIEEGFELAVSEDSAREAIAPKKAPAFFAVDGALRARASLSSPPVVELPEGTEVTIYPQHDAPIGWLLAQGPDGEIGFVQLEDIETMTVVG